MAEMTKQFLNPRVRRRNYETEPVYLLFLKREPPTTDGIVATVSLQSLDDEYRVQRLFLGSDDRRKLAVDLLKSIKRDSEVLDVIREALAARRPQ